MTTKPTEEKPKLDLSRFKKSDTDLDAFEPHDFDTNDTLMGTILKIKGVTVTRQGKEHPTRLAVVDTQDGKKLLWESANLENFFDELEIGMEIAVIYNGMTDLKAGKKMRSFDAYHS